MDNKILVKFIVQLENLNCIGFDKRATCFEQL